MKIYLNHMKYKKKQGKVVIVSSFVYFSFRNIELET